MSCGSSTLLVTFLFNLTIRNSFLEESKFCSPKSESAGSDGEDGFRLRGDGQAGDVDTKVSFRHRSCDTDLQLLDVGRDASLVHVHCRENLIKMLGFGYDGVKFIKFEIPG